MPSTVKFPEPTSNEFGAKLPVSVKSLSSAFLLLSIAAVKLGPINNEPDPVLILILLLAVISVPAIVVNAPVLVVEIPTAPSKLVLAVITVPSIVVAPIVVLSGTLAPIVVPSIAPPLISTVENVDVPERTSKSPAAAISVTLKVVMFAVPMSAFVKYACDPTPSTLSVSKYDVAVNPRPSILPVTSPTKSAVT